VRFAFIGAEKATYPVRVLGHKRIEIHQVLDPIARAVGDPCGNHAAIAVADQDDIA
jgi:hypothetical protein